MDHLWLNHLPSRLKPYRWCGLLRADGSVDNVWEVGAVFARDGYAYPRPHHAGRKKPLGRWYAVIQNVAGPIVRRDKLDDLRAIEATRWRIVQKLRDAMDDWEAAYDEAKALGRIWSKRDGRGEFVLWTGGPGLRISPAALLKQRGSNSAVDQLAVLPTTEEEEAGARYDETDARGAQWTRRLQLLDTILDKAMTITGRVKPATDPATGRPRHQTFRCTINGRLYIACLREPGVDSTNVWPGPEDVHVDFDA